MNRQRHPDTALVYSSELGRICPDCSRPVRECTCRAQSVPASDGVIRIRRETKGRGGKTVTVVTGLPPDGNRLKTIAGDLKRRCGTGGTIKDGALEIQGDHRELLAGELRARGYTVKFSGG